MRHYIALLILPLLFTLSGCRISRQPESLTPEPPAPVYIETAPVQPVPPSSVEIAPPPTDEPSSLDYANTLVDLLYEARQQAKDKDFSAALRPDAPLAAAGLSLSLLESSLPQSRALWELQNIKKLVSDQKLDEAQIALDQLIIDLQPHLINIPDEETLSVASLQAAQKALIDEDSDAAKLRLDNISHALASLPQLQKIREIRTDLEAALDAAARRRSAVFETVVENATDTAASLEALLKGSTEPKPKPAGGEGEAS